MSEKRVMLYGLWERNRSGGGWHRLMPACAYPKRQAVRMFQNALLGPFLDGSAARLERRLIAVGHVLSYGQ